MNLCLQNGRAGSPGRGKLHLGPSQGEKLTLQPYLNTFALFFFFFLEYGKRCYSLRLQSLKNYLWLIHLCYKL